MKLLVYEKETNKKTKKKNLRRKGSASRAQPFAVCLLSVPSLSIRPSFVLHPAIASIGTYNLKKPLVNEKGRKKKKETY